MKSGKQRSKQIKARRAAVAAERDARAARAKQQALSTDSVPVNVTALAPYNSYGAPKFVERGFYLDEPYRCRACGKQEVWRAAQQKWWYEVAKGYVYSTAALCRPCRRKEQARRREARETHLQGLARKAGESPTPGPQH